MNGIKYRFADEMKDSGIEWIGNIPKDWEIKKIKHIATINMGQSPDSSYVNQDGKGIPFLQGKAEFGLKAPKAVYFCTNPTKIIKANSILFSVRAPVGEMNFADLDYCIGRGLAGITSNGNRNFLYYSLINAKEYIQSISTGSTFDAVSTKQLLEIDIPNGPEFDLLKISNYLDVKTAQFDSIIAKKEQLIAKLEEAKKSLISEVVTGKVKIVDGQLVPRQPEEMKDSGSILLDQIPINWNVSRIRHVFQERNTKCLNKFATLLSVSRHHGVILQSEAEELELATIAPAESMVGYKVVKSGDLVMNIMRAKDGSFGVSGVDGVVSPAYCIYSCQNKQNSSYFYYLFKTQRFINAFENYSTGIAEHRMRLYPENFFEILVCVPILESQNEIVEFLDAKMERYKKHIEKNRQHIEQIKSAKQSLISEAVTGKIDLRDWEIIEQGGAS